MPCLMLRRAARRGTADPEMPNKRPSAVPKRAGDARTRRTQQALSEALVALMLDRDFADITVQDVLDRAGVGRSTFYAHFRSKDDFLLSDAERFIGMLEQHFTSTADARRLLPLGELASHVGAYAEFARALERAGKGREIWDLFTGHFARIAEPRIMAAAPGSAVAGLPPTVGARVLAAAAVELLRWWMDRPQTLSPQQLDERFHAMAWRGVGAAPR